MRVNSTRHAAFTLIEILVVIVILAIILAITIPAVMQTRESARRTQCLNNLKSLALASNAHLDQKNYYPQSYALYSPFVYMLPYLDQAALYNSFNLSKHRAFVYGPKDVNYTAYSTTVFTFICPSNIITDTALGPCSYGGNVGTGIGRSLLPDNGPFAILRLSSKIRDALVRDGLANTVSLSEFCRTAGRATVRDQHAVYQIGSYQKNQFDAMISDCSAIDIDKQTIDPGFRGFCWAFAGIDNTLYDHNIQPNHHACTCDGGALQGAWAASSFHANGVNCAHLDGHVSFVRETIALPTWRALGTINGGEIFPDQSSGRAVDRDAAIMDVSSVTPMRTTDLNRLLAVERL